MTKKRKMQHFLGTVRKPSDTKQAVAWGFIVLPKDVSQSLPRRGRLTANLALNGVPFQATLEPDGTLSHWFRVDATLMKKTSVNFGEEVEVNLEAVATEPRPTPPPDLAKALKADSQFQEGWDSTSAIAQVDWIHWIDSAKQAATRAKRIASAADMLAKGKKRVCCFDPSGFYSKEFSAPEEASD